VGFEGFEHASFDGDQLMELLAELDAELGAHTAGTGPYRVAIAGGAAMALRLSDRLTGDVDVVSEGMHPDVRRAAEAVASRHDLRPDWINDAAKLKTSVNSGTGRLRQRVQRKQDGISSGDIE